MTTGAGLGVTRLTVVKPQQLFICDLSFWLAKSKFWVLMLKCPSFLAFITPLSNPFNSTNPHGSSSPHGGPFWAGTREMGTVRQPPTDPDHG